MYVKDHMTKNPTTVTKETSVSKALDLMNQGKFHRLPVVDDDNKVVGIITEKDMFQAFVDLMGYKHQGTKFVISCEDTPGIFAKAAKLFADNDANLESCAVYHTEERGAEVVIKATGEISVEDMQKILEDNGFDLTSIIQTDYDGNKIVYLNKH